MYCTLAIRPFYLFIKGAPPLILIFLEVFVEGSHLFQKVRAPSGRLGTDFVEFVENLVEKIVENLVEVIEILCENLVEATFEFSRYDFPFADFEVWLAMVSLGKWFLAKLLAGYAACRTHAAPSVASVCLSNSIVTAEPKGVAPMTFGSPAGP